MTDEIARRRRMYAATGGDPQFATSSAVITWRCRHKQRRKILEVFRERNGWRVEGKRFRTTVDDNFRRLGLGLTAADVRQGRAVGGRKLRVSDRKSYCPSILRYGAISTGRLRLDAHAGLPQPSRRR